MDAWSIDIWSLPNVLKTVLEVTWKSHQWGFQQPKWSSWWSWEGHRIPYNQTEESGDHAVKLQHQRVLPCTSLTSCASAGTSKRLAELAEFVGFSCCQVDSCNAWAMDGVLFLAAFFQGDLAWSVLGPGICCSKDEPCPELWCQENDMWRAPDLTDGFLTTSKWQMPYGHYRQSVAEKFAQMRRMNILLGDVNGKLSLANSSAIGGSYLDKSFAGLVQF